MTPDADPSPPPPPSPTPRTPSALADHPPSEPTPQGQAEPTAGPAPSAAQQAPRPTSWISPEAMTSPEFGFEPPEAAPPSQLPSPPPTHSPENSALSTSPESQTISSTPGAPQSGKRLGREARAALLASFRAAASRAASRHGVSLKRSKVFRPLRVFDAAYAGLLVTAIVVLATVQGWLYVPEQWTYDLRTRFAQYGRPAPTDKLVHIDMDDRSIDDIGRWPWSRSTQALVLEELAAAGPKAVALDILYDKPEKATIEKIGENQYITIDHDKKFTEALAKLGCAVIAYSHVDLDLNRPNDAIYGKVVNELLRRPIMEEAELRSLLPADERGRVDDYFHTARKEAVSLAVAGFMAEKVRPLEEVIGLIESGASPAGVATTRRSATAAPTTAPTASAAGAVIDESPIRRMITEAWSYEMGRRAIAPSRIPASTVVLEQFDDRLPQILPLAEFARASAIAAFVTYNKGGDGIMRRVPLVMNAEGRASMSLGLALALKILDVKPSQVTVRSDSLSIPIEGGTIEVPMRTYRFNSLTRETAGVFDLPYIGNAGASTWQTMYDAPGTPIRHTLSASRIWQSIQLRSRIASNNLRLREAALTMLGETNSAKEKKVWDPYDANAWTQFAREMLELNADDIKILSENPPADPGPRPPLATPAQRQEHEEAVRAFKLHRAAVAAESLLKELNALGKEAAQIRNELREQLAGKAVLVGWTATGRTDFVATPLHPACAGVRVHGLVFNAILSRNFLNFAPDWQGLLITMAMGLIGTWAVVRLSPPVAMLTTVFAAVAYIGLAAMLFGPYGYVVAVAPPLFAMAGAWALASMSKFVVERAERNRILKRFQTYVDPQLVNYLLQNPERAGLDGERRLMTVCFTDLAGFTTLSERLGEQTVGMLNEYFALMVPLVRKHHGYVNKLLGDGMMFFFNAPQPNPLHAASAFNAVLEMQQVMHDFNQGLIERGLPTLKMRVGITTGQMIAGDAGGGGYNDFTVLGDVVNLSSRLEGANKASGTLILCNKASLESAGPEFLTRPVGFLRVVGKTEGIETFEVMSRRDTATEKQILLARLTESLVLAYRRADLDSCLRIADQIEETFGATKITDLYRDLCNAHAVTGLPDGFDGTIVLETK